MSTYKPGPGENIAKTAEEMVRLADESQEPVTAVFNDTNLTANPGVTAESIIMFFVEERARSHQEWINTPEGQKAMLEREEAQRRKAAAAAEPLKQFTLKDAEVWQQAVSSSDEYGKWILRYAARWANLMEQKMSEGQKLEDIANITSHEADLEYMSGYGHGRAVTILVQAWEYGEQLRRWHNLQYQSKDSGKEEDDTGDVIDPSSLIFSIKN